MFSIKARMNETVGMSPSPLGTMDGLREKSLLWKVCGEATGRRVC